MNSKRILFLGAFLFLIFSVEVSFSQDDDIGPRVRYPRETSLSFKGIRIEGEVRNPGEFYFKDRKEEKFTSLVKRRKNFHKEMLRDSVLLK